MLGRVSFYTARVVGIVSVRTDGLWMTSCVTPIADHRSAKSVDTPRCRLVWPYFITTVFDAGSGPLSTTPASFDMIFFARIGTSANACVGKDQKEMVRKVNHSGPTGPCFLPMTFPDYAMAAATALSLIDVYLSKATSLVTMNHDAPF
jgi:hypothetical protein